MWQFYLGCFEDSELIFTVATPVCIPSWGMKCSFLTSVSCCFKGEIDFKWSLDWLCPSCWTFDDMFIGPISLLCRDLCVQFICSFIDGMSFWCLALRGFCRLWIPTLSDREDLLLSVLQAVSAVCRVVSFGASYSPAYQFLLRCPQLKALCFLLEGQFDVLLRSVIHFELIFLLIGWEIVSKPSFSSGVEKGCLSFSLCFGTFMEGQVGTAVWVCLSLVSPWSVCLQLSLVSTLLFWFLCLCSVVWGQGLWDLHHCSFSPGLLFCTSISGMAPMWKVTMGHQQPYLAAVSQDFPCAGLLWLALAPLAGPGSFSWSWLPWLVPLAVPGSPWLVCLFCPDLALITVVLSLWARPGLPVPGYVSWSSLCVKVLKSAC